MAWLACLSGLFGCDRITAPAVNPAAIGISIKDAPNDPPQFKRIYTKALSDGRTITVTFRRSYAWNNRLSSGELTQRNGHWVLFDIDRIADKIIDPKLVPFVEEAVKHIKALDHEYMQSNPSAFIDEDGQRWVKG